MIVTLDEAVRQLRQCVGEDSDAIESIVLQAEDWAARVCRENWDDAWTGETIPYEIKSAILSRIGALYDQDSELFTLADKLIEPWRDHVAR